MFYITESGKWEGAGSPRVWSDVKNNTGARSAGDIIAVGARSDFENGWSVER